MTPILYSTLVPVLLTSPERLHSACLLTQLILLLLLFPLLMRTLNKRLPIHLLPYFTLYSAPALIIASHTSEFWWVVVPAEVALLSTATAVWTASNHISQKSSPLFWSVLVSLLSLPVLLDEVAKPFYRNIPLRFLSPVGYILSPFDGEVVVALWGGLLVWVPVVVIVVSKRKGV